VNEGERLYQLRPGVYSATGEQGTVTLLRVRQWPQSMSLGQLSADGRAALRLLAERPCAVADLPGSEPDEVKALLATLHAGGWLTTTVCWAGRQLYTVQPLRSVPDPPAVDEAVVLSRFTVLRREGDDLVVESPLATATVRAHDPAVSAVLGTLVSTAHANGIHGGLPDHVVTQLLLDLRAAGLAVPTDNAEDTEPRLRQWRPHELWFHGRSRQGNGGYAGLAYGRTKWAKGIFDPTPARHDPFPGPVVELSRPSLDTLRHNDLPLTAVVEDRRSTRTHDDDHPITAEQLGELLYRCSGVRGSFVADGVEHLRLPYPAGGSVYELELYPVVRQASGLDPGMYHYDRHEHQLRLVREPGHEVARLLRSAALSASVDRPPQVLIVLAARFGRLMYTYEELPYALVLKHVGVLYQTMYLVATAMGLAACALGGGDALAFNEATGLDYATESSVGEFMLGSRPKE
jgi:SagB-type dehydrogenase family enzyme